MVVKVDRLEHPLFTEELWNLHQGRRNKPAEIFGIKP